MKRIASILSMVLLPLTLLGMDFFSAGFTGGPSLSTQWSPKDRGFGADVTTESLLKYQAGIYAEWSLNRIFAIRPEIRYARRGAEHLIVIPDFLFPSITARYAYDYIEIPILLRTVPFDWRPVRPCLTGGLYAGRRIGRPEYTFTLPGFGAFTQPMKGLEEWDWGFTSGYGIEWVPGRLRFAAEYRFSMGFTELSLPTGPGFPEVRLQNMAHALSLEVGARF
ncbi:MAG: porin family protein [bacterium]|nr:porin family protein [bacterium]